MIDVSDLIGIPYKDNGRSKEEGFDCYGLVIECEKRLGKTLKDVVYESHDIALAEENSPLLNIKKTDSIKEGSILEIHKDNSLHIAFALDSKKMIHATNNQGVRISLIPQKFLINVYEVI